MKKTKIFALLLALLMVATMVAACTPAADNSGDTSSDASATPSGDTSDPGDTTGKGTIILGNSTELGGLFHHSSFGVSNPGAADNDVNSLTTELGTVVASKDGNYVWNPTVVKDHKETVNEDGSKTFEIEIYDDLKFSDGSAVTAKDYLAYVLAFSSPVADQASGTTNRAGMTLVGYDAFKAYDGTNDGVDEASKAFAGVRMLGEYKFSFTVHSDHLPYYYDTTYAAVTAQYAKKWIGDAEIKDDGEGCYLTEAFYAKNDEGKYATADTIKDTAYNADHKYPYSGPYYVESYDTTNSTATLKLNPYYKGNYEGTKPSIGTVVYKYVVTETMIEALRTGEVDVLMGVTGGDVTLSALQLVKDSEGKFDSVDYGRAGYGKLGFRSDFGPIQFESVRKAIAYSLDRPDFAKKFTGGYGGVVHGPYYKDFWAYKAVSSMITLQDYAKDTNKAIAILEADGWVYDKDGNEYTSGVRYKKIPASEIKEADTTYASKDGSLTTTKVGDDYYMPLVINWFGTTPNDFTDLLEDDFAGSSNISGIGMSVQYSLGNFSAMLAELYQQDYGGATYGGTPMYSAFNFATGFNSAVYDYSWNCTVDNEMFLDYSQWYLMDAADIIYADGTIASGYINLDGKTYGEDYDSLYNKFGTSITANDVKVDEDKNAYIEVEGKKYILGLDFLSMAMVYNCEGTLEEQNQQYALWWMYFEQRWNAMLPEIPLYSNQYFDVYNTKIQGVKENPTNPLWGPANALIDWTIAE